MVSQVFKVKHNDGHVFKMTGTKKEVTAYCERKGHLLLGIAGDDPCDLIPVEDTSLYTGGIQNGTAV